MKKILMITVLLLLPSVLLAQYSVVLKNGRTLKSKVKPVFIFGHVLYTDMDGNYYDLKYTEVDIEKTWQVNSKVKPKKDKKKEVITSDMLKRMTGKLTVPIAGEEGEEEGATATPATRERTSDADQFTGQQYTGGSRR